MALPDGCTILASGDPHRLSILTLLSNISPRSIVGYDSWQRALVKKRAEGVPLYIFPEADLERGADPEVG